MGVGDQDRRPRPGAAPGPGEQFGRVPPHRDPVLAREFPAPPVSAYPAFTRIVCSALRSTVKQYGISRSPAWPCSSSPSGERARANSITQME